MYPAWSWGGTTAAVTGSPTAAGYVQPTAASTGQSAGTQWPANYSQYAALTPEMQQQWAAAWASQAQLAYSGSVPVAGQVPTTGAYAGLTEAQPSDNSSKAEKPKNTSDEAAIDPEEEEFERQFKDWEKQFETWKEQNINHPDKEAFAQYEKQWQEWRAQLLQKKEQMQKAKAERLAAKMAQASTALGQVVPTGADGAAADPNLYYQQYMYMQAPYMYSAAQGATDAAQQYPYGAQNADGYGAASAGPAGVAAMNANPNMSTKEQENDQYYGQPGMNYSSQGEPYQNYDDYGMPNAYPPEDEHYQRDMGYGRGRSSRGRSSARGSRGRGRGRGGRWSDDMDNQPPDMRSQGPLLDNPEFQQGRSFRGEGEFHGDGDYPCGFPSDRRNFKGDFNQGNFPPRGPRDFPPDEFRDGPKDGHPPYDYPPDDFRGGDFDRDGMPYPDQPGGRGRRNFPPNGRFPGGKKGMPARDGPPPRGEGPPSEQSSRFPPEDFDEPYPPFEDGFPPPDGDRFPPPRGKNGRFMMDRGGDFDGFPPMEGDRFGPPPFRDDFPPFDDRFPPGRGGGGRFRGRFRGRGGYDRFGPHDYPPDMREGEPFGPDDRFPFPGDGPPRMGDGPRMGPGDGPRMGPGDGPPRRGRGGMRSAFGPGRFPPDDPYFEDGPPPSMRFNSIEYTHRPADDFDPHYEYENEFQDDVGKFRDNFSSNVNVAAHDPIIFSQVPVESFDYQHGLEPMTTIPARKDDFKPEKVFDYGHQGTKDNIPDGKSLVDYPDAALDAGPPFRDRYNDRGGDFDRFGRRGGRDDRDMDLRERPYEKNRDVDFRDFDARDRDFDARDKDRDLKRSRDWDRGYRDEDKEKRSKWDGRADADRSKDRSSNNSREKKDSDDLKNSSTQAKPESSLFKSEGPSETTLIDDILVLPKRLTRPKQLVIILRGLPGSGKTYVAKLIKDKEIENGGSAPRILSLDDYFMVDVEVTDTDPDTGKKVKRKEFKFEYESSMEEVYRANLFKAFKKTIDDRFFPFIIVDAAHEKSKQYEQFWSYAKQRGFQVYIAEMDCNDPVMCHKRNIHNRTLEDINKILESWETKPRHFMNLDVRSLLQEVAITEVEMEVESDVKPDDDDVKAEENEDDKEEDSNNADDLPDDLPFHIPSRWEALEATEEKLDKLDGLKLGKKKQSSMEDYLQLPDDYEERKCEPGKKRVRWADLEERKEQDRIRAIGFVVGQTDWNKMTDPSHADRALTKTKYF